MPTKYKNTSPYNKTPQTTWYLGLWEYRRIPPDSSDNIFVVTPKYHLRPDKAAGDLWGSRQLFWIFRMRNPNYIQDPIYDFVNGMELYIPTKDRIMKLMGS